MNKNKIAEHVAKMSDEAQRDMVAGRWDDAMTDALYAACGAETTDEMQEARGVAEQCANNVKNKNEIIQNAGKITVINDGQFRYPVLTEAMRSWVASHGPITTANYEQFCADVDCIGEKEIGTPGNVAMVELCEELLAAGADSERLG